MVEEAKRSVNMGSRKNTVLLAFLLALHSFSIQPAFAWSNGGFSSDPSNPDYGTHDWIAQHALDWLPSGTRQHVLDNLAVYLYGTELPDNGQAPDGIGDTVKHHVYFHSSGALQDDSAAVRAAAEYLNALNYLKQGDFAKAAKYAGIMTHYISDVAVFGHVMGSETDWGKETRDRGYEDYVQARTATYNAEFNSYLAFDGSLNNVSAYDATKNLAFDTTFDLDGGLTAVWMDRNYDWRNVTFRNRAGESLNLAVNCVTDVLYMLYMQAGGEAAERKPTSISCVLPRSTITRGETVNISGAINVTVATTIIIQVSIDSGATWSNLTMVGTDSQGAFSYTWTPVITGTYRVRVTWHGNSEYEGATSNVLSVSVTKIPTAISCKVSSSEATEGSLVSVSGSINPSASGKAIALVYRKPDGTTVVRTAVTGVDGSYSDACTPDTTGQWSVTATWNGDERYEGAVSSTVSFTVNPAFPVLAVAVAGTMAVVAAVIFVFLLRRRGFG